jgi:hypothetical protein
MPSNLYIQLWSQKPRVQAVGQIMHYTLMLSASAISTGGGENYFASHFFSCG